MFEEIQIDVNKEKYEQYEVFKDRQISFDSGIDEENFSLDEKHFRIRNEIEQSLKKNIYCDPDIKSTKNKKSLESYMENIFLQNKKNKDKIKLKSKESIFDFMMSKIQIKNKIKKPIKSFIKEKDEKLKNCKKCIRTNLGNEKFCHHKSELIEGKKKIIECKDCFTDFCELCFSLCHKNCVKIKGKLKNYMVFESASSCRCSHHYKKIDFKLECFYSNFLFKNLELNEKKYYKLKENGLTICNFCASNHYEESNLEEYNHLETNITNLICQCNNTYHDKFHCLDLYEFLQKIYKQISCEIEYSVIRNKFKAELKDFMKSKNNKNSEKKKLKFDYFSIEIEEFIDNEVTKFSIHNLIYNGMLKYKPLDEINLINSFGRFEDYSKFNYDKVNLHFTFIFHFYRKNLFLLIEPVTENNIDVIPFEYRLKMFNKNKKIFQQLKEFYNKLDNYEKNDNELKTNVSITSSSEKYNDIFSIEEIFFSLYRVKNLNNFMIYTTNNENFPFYLYLLINFSYCYCFSKKELYEFSTLVDENFNYDFYKKYSRIIDNIFYINQFNYNDNRITQLIKRNNEINEKTSITYKSNYGNSLFESKNFIIDNSLYMNGYKFIRFIFPTFKYEFNYHRNFIKNEEKDNNYLIHKEYRCFNLFNINYLEKLGDKNKICDLQKIFSQENEIPINFKSVNEFYECSFIYRNEIDDFIVFKENKVDLFLSRILSKFIPFLTFTDQNQSENYDVIIEHFFFSLKKKFKKNDFCNLKIKINNINECLELDNIDFTKHKEEIKYLFLHIICFYERSEFVNILKKWNLLLFLFLSNLKNFKFVLFDLNLLDYFTNNFSLLKDSKNINQGQIKIKDFTWNFLYLAYKYILKNENEFKFHNKKFEKQYYQFLNSSCSIREEEQINNTFLYYYLKIYFKTKNLDNFKFYSPFENNKIAIHSFINKINKFVFKECFQFENYLNSFKIFDNKEDGLENKIKLDDFIVINENPINDYLNENIISKKEVFSNENNDFNENILYLQLESNDKDIYKSIGIENIKILIINIMGNLKTADKWEYNQYYNILHKNYNFFVQFFNNIQNIITKFPYLKNKINRLQLIIQKFMVNFLTLKRFNFDKIDVVDEVNITYDELNILVKSDSLNDYLGDLDFINYKIESKYLIYSIKIKIVDFVKLHFPIIDNKSQELHVYFYQIFKKFYFFLEECNFDPSKAIHQKNEEEQNSNSLKNKEKKLKESILDFSFDEDKELEEYKLPSKSKTRNNDNVKNILDFINHYKKYEIIHESKFESSNYSIFSKFYYNINRKYSTNSKHLLNFFGKDEKFIRFEKYEETTLEFWINFYHYFKKDCTILISILFSLIFKSLKNLEKFDESFSSEMILMENLDENFLKQVNFLNNLIYHNSLDFQDKLLNGTNPENIKLLLIIVIKLNYYLIKVFNFIDEKIFFSISQAYFILMDFFILINEYSEKNKLDIYFFEEFGLRKYKYDKADDEEEKPQNQININKFNKNNFYYHCFLQLKNILSLLKKNQKENYIHINIPTNHLIIHFLYLIRILKECLEIDISYKNNNKILIINYCFENIFDLYWIDIMNINNENLSFIITYELLNLLNTYLEEHSAYISVEFKKKIDEALNYELLYKAIAKCFDLAIDETKDENFVRSGISFESLKNLYFKDEKLFENKYFELSEQIYKTLNLTDYDDYLNFCRKFYNKNMGEKFSYRIYYSHYCKDEIIENYRKRFIIYFNFLEFICKEIQIKFIDSNGRYKFRKIYFFKSPRCYFLNKSLKDSFLEKAPRNSILEKLDFFNKKLDLMLLMSNFAYKKKFSFFNKFDKYMTEFLKYLDIFNFILCLFINLFLMIVIYVKEDNIIISKEDLNSQIFFYSRSQLVKDKFIIYSVVGVISFLQFISLLFWYYKNYESKNLKYYYKITMENRYLFPKRDDKNDSNKTLNEPYSNKHEEKFKIDENESFKILFETYSEMRKKFFNLEDSYFDMKNEKKKLEFYWIKFKNLIFNKEIKYILFSLLCNLLFLISSYTLLLVLPILSIIRIYSLFGYFLKAILRKYKEFMALLIFIYVIEYIFSWITFLHFQELMISEYRIRTGDLNEGSKTEIICSTIIECFLNYLDLGLRLGGGIGDSSPRISYKFDTNNNYFKKLFWDILFHILINLILSNIFFGVIVDTFNELRSIDDVKKNDDANKCFMCNKDRFDIDFFNKNFDDHRSIEHGIFNYVYFIHYLLKKNPEVYNRAESYAWEQIISRKIDWLPYIHENLEKNN